MAGRRICHARIPQRWLRLGAPLSRQFGINALRLYAPDVRAVYEKYGRREIETLHYNGKTVGVMRLESD